MGTRTTGGPTVSGANADIYKDDAVKVISDGLWAKGVVTKVDHASNKVTVKFDKTGGIKEYPASEVHFQKVDPEDCAVCEGLGKRKSRMPWSNTLKDCKACSGTGRAGSSPSSPTS